MTSHGRIGRTLSLVLAAWHLPNESVAAPARKMIVLGIDGMDARLLEQLMESGSMPNMAALAKRGSYQRLATSTPPESPVAWSEFITGEHSDKHGIYDFVHRDLREMTPMLSTSRASGPETAIRIGSFELPLGGGRIELLRRGRAFWDDLADAHVSSRLRMVPASYPAIASDGVELTSGMGTPDLLGTYGIFQLFTNDPAWAGKRPSGGRVFPIAVQRAKWVKARLQGPPSPFSADGRPLEDDLDLLVDLERSTLLVRLGSEERMLQPGEWTDWVPVEFTTAVPLTAIRGMVRMYLRSTNPYLTLYVSALQIDPLDPAQPISSPPGLSAALAGAVGRYHTLGIPEDIKALEAGVFDDDTFLDQVTYILRERERILFHELERFDGGFLFVYFGSIDQASHAFWNEPRRVPDLYRRIDEIVGRVARKVSDDAAIVVMSDHGFAPYRRKVNLNTWLMHRGYLALKSPSRDASGALGHIDWSRTKAYGLGLNLLYLNRAGREPSGIVTPEEADMLLTNLMRDLRSLRDPLTDESAVSSVTPVRDQFYPGVAPDLIVGYASGYRCSDASAVAMVSSDVFETNTDKWSGDHCMDAAVVPGILTSNLILGGPASLADLPPTILEYFGVTPRPDIRGRSLLRENPKEQVSWQR
jgi:predicted AlkP superfamily phosphohydrolase/phosphomutase